MDCQIGFTLTDLLEFFAAAKGKVVYSEIVTHFKPQLSNPATQAEARILFKDHVNTLATVTNENGKKYLVLRPKYMRKLFVEETTNEVSDNSNSGNSNALSLSPSTALSPINTTPLPHNGIDASCNVDIHTKPIVNKTQVIRHQMPACQTESIGSNVTAPVASFMPTIITTTTATNTTNTTTTTTATSSSINGDSQGTNQSTVIASQQLQQTASNADEVPPRPPPRKKGSFSKRLSQCSTTGDTKDNQENNSSTPSPAEANHEVKKEIQELTKTPGRVKEHAQILNKLASADVKLPMPNGTGNVGNSNSVHTNVVNKIRNGYHGTDSDSGSIQFADSQRIKRWVLAASNCDYAELVSLLKEEPKLSSYCDSIAGYNALHWAAKFNKPEVVKLIAGKYGVSVNLKSFSGSTPLHLAAQFGHQTMMNQLISSYGANEDIRDNYGFKPRHYLTLREKAPNESTHHGLHSRRNVINDTTHNSTSATVAPVAPPSATENLKNNLRNKISHQSMLVRNTLRKSKAFQRRKSIASK